MWGKKNLNAPLGVPPEPQSLPTTQKGNDSLHQIDSTSGKTKARLGSGLRVKGDITGSEDLLIDGSVEGVIELGERKLTVGTTAKLISDINASEVVVYGHVKGNVHAKGRIEIRKGGSVIGNLTTAQIMVEEGADFRGSIEIDRNATKEAEKNTFARAASAGAARV
jgi:cytoskeletal protein CcmA (bactofilin family)